MLIAFVLVALISLLLFSGLRLGLRSWESVETAAENNAELRLAREFLMRTLSQARAASLMLEANPYLIFAGDGRNLEFVAPLAEQVGIPGLYVLRLGLVQQGGDTALALTRWLLHPDVLAGNAEVPAWQPLAEAGGVMGTLEDVDLAAGAFGTSILLEGVEKFEISYFGLVEGEDPALTTDPKKEWQGVWEARQVLPQAIRIHLTTPRRLWPDLIIPLISAGPGPGVTLSLPR